MVTRCSWPGRVVPLLAALAACACFTPATRAQEVTNPSFETPDPAAPTVKPLGWYRQTYINNELPTSANADQVIPPWLYVTNGTPGDTTHTGTHSVGVSGGNAGTIYSWEMEGNVAGQGATFNNNVNPDNRGNGPMVAVTKGGLYHISAWYKKTFAGGASDSRVRYAFSANGAAATWGGGSSLFVDPAAVNVWTEISANVTATDNFLVLRAYSVNVPAGQTIYWDDFTVTLVGLPQTFTGIVKDSAGNPVANAAVGLSSQPNGLADPEGQATTGADGRFSISFVKGSGNYVAQAWLPGDAASADVPLQPAGTDTVITYDPKPLANLAQGRPIIASSQETNGSFPPSAANDGDFGSRWSSRGPDAALLPHFLIIDLGTSIDFPATGQQFVVSFETARPNHYQIRVSDTPPDPAMYTPINAGNHALALNYGTVVYDSPQSDADRAWTGTGFGYTHVITNITPGKGRYVMLLLDKLSGAFTNVSVYEFQVGVKPVTVTGKVVDTSGNAVPGAIVMASPAGAVTQASDTGSFSFVLPALGTLSLQAHTIDTALVYPMSASVKVPLTGDTVNAGNLTIGAPAANLVTSSSPVDAFASADPTVAINDPANPPTNAVDQNFDTRWVTVNPIPNISTLITPDKPLYFIVDLGSSQPLDEILLHWEAAYPGAYHVDLANTYDMAGRTGGDWTTVYTKSDMNPTYLVPTTAQYVHVVTFPTRSARYIRVAITQPGPYPVISMWEIQAANVTLPPVPNALTIQALRIAGGLEAAPAAGPSFDALNANTSGTSASEIDILDAVTLMKQGK